MVYVFHIIVVPTTRAFRPTNVLALSGPELPKSHQSGRWPLPGAREGPWNIEVFIYKYQVLDGLWGPWYLLFSSTSQG